VTAESPRSERPPVGTGYAVLGCLAGGIQALLGIVILLIVMAAPLDPRDEGALGLFKAAFVGVWVISAILLYAGWARRSRLIIVVAIVAFVLVWTVGTAVREAFPYSNTITYGP